MGNRFIALCRRPKYDYQNNGGSYWDDTVPLAPGKNQHTDVAIYSSAANARRFNKYKVGGRDEFRGEVLELDFDFLPRVDSQDDQAEYERAERLMQYWAQRADDLRRKISGRP